MSDTRNCSGALKAFCTIIRSTEWEDSKIPVPSRGLPFWIVLTGCADDLREQA